MYSSKINEIVRSRTHIVSTLHGISSYISYHFRPELHWLMLYHLDFRLTNHPKDVNWILLLKCILIFKNPNIYNGQTCQGVNIYKFVYKTNYLYKWKIYLSRIIVFEIKNK